MNARDELMGTLSNTICNASLYPPTATAHLLGGDMSNVLEKTADAILAAGYRKPRTITTTDELDATSRWAVILCEGDRTGEGVGSRAFRWGSHKERLSDGQITYFKPIEIFEDFEAVSVLFEPEATR